ncbi:MAG: DNA mismatch repair endonuclease MutL [Bacteroidota bacterium]
MPDAADGIIRPLPDTLASKIAAGEVVQRPANALKELIENALDAGASRIDVTLQRAGSELIQVADDGCGMGQADAEACFGRHATSKLRRFEDLEALRTLGFRGEALASIASVAQVELTTRRRQDDAGTRVRVDGGEVASIEPCGAPEGTTISVRNLFYNVPARRAFLKSPATEFKHLVEAFQALALSHPDVAFSLTHDGNEVWKLAAVPGEHALAERLSALAGGSLDGVLIPVEEAMSYLSVRGVIARPERAKRSRGEQYTFVNGRFVKSRQVQHAIANAYGALLPERHHPLYALFLDVDPRHVDVNVHPTKTEVKFDDDRGVYAVVQAVVKKALAEGGLGMSFETDAPHVPQAAPVLAESPDLPGVGPAHDPPAGDGATSIRVEATASPGGPSLAPPVFVGDDLDDPVRVTSLPEALPVIPAPLTGPIPSRVEAASGPVSDEDLDLDAQRTLWQLHGRYLLSPVRSGLLVVDQRAAHERILYEKALASMESGMAPSQQLLFPFTVDLGPADRALLDEIIPDLRALGFEMDALENGPVLVRGVPSDVTLGHERDVLDDLLAQYRRNRQSLRLSARENLARSLASRSAIRHGHSLGAAEARTLVDQLFGCSDPFSDPNGRPTMTRLSSDEIDRRFR